MSGLIALSLDDAEALLVLVALEHYLVILQHAQKHPEIGERAGVLGETIARAQALMKRVSEARG